MPKFANFWCINTQLMDFTKLKQALSSLPAGATEPIVCNIFVSELLKTLGFDNNETVPEFKTGSGGNKVDFAVRKNVDKNIFIETLSNPYLLLEAKARTVNLSPGAKQYQSTVNQLKGYLLNSSCKSAKWGIITNANHIQLFRKHDKVIHPALPCLEITTENLDKIIDSIKQKIEKPKKALTIAVYNNKGGVGKTTTTVNLAAALSILGKRTLILDFDPNQRDLTNFLAIKPQDDSLYSWLINKKYDLQTGLIKTHKCSPKSGTIWQFDIIASDNKLQQLEEHELRKFIHINRLRQLLEPFQYEYDYILIDSPPNWKFFSQSAIYAADVVLIPTKHNSIFSLENAVTVIKHFIPEIQRERKDGGAIALPIFFNGESITDAGKRNAQQAINTIIQQHQIDKINPINLIRYFYPKYTATTKNQDIFAIPSYANIASAAFARVPATYKNKTAYDYYLSLAKEYFIQ